MSDRLDWEVQNDAFENLDRSLDVSGGFARGALLVEIIGVLQGRCQRAPDGKLMAVPIAVNGSDFKLGTAVALFQTRISGGGLQLNNRRQYDVAPDGRFLINTSIEDPGSPFTLLLNWKPPAK